MKEKLSLMNLTDEEMKNVNGASVGGPCYCPVIGTCCQHLANAGFGDCEGDCAPAQELS